MSILVLKNATLAQLHPAKVEEGVDIVIENDRIIETGANLSPRYPQARIKEMHGRLVMPGMVCSHNHFIPDCRAEFRPISRRVPILSPR